MKVSSFAFVIAIPAFPALLNFLTGAGVAHGKNLESQFPAGAIKLRGGVDHRTLIGDSLRISSGATGAIRGASEAPPPPVLRRRRLQSLGDWEFCSTSDQCNNGCCSSVYSDDGQLKCTPLIGGFTPDICVVSDDGEDGATGTPQSPADLGDWETCLTSDQCNNGCCGSMYSHDGQLKCTPLNGGFHPDICVAPNGDGGVPTSPTQLGDWEVCSESSECNNGCCSSVYSDDSQLKCTPLDGGFRPDICVAGDGSGTSTDPPEPSMYTLELSTDSPFDAGILESIQQTFDSYYSVMASFYNPSATRVVKIHIQDEWDGIPGWAIGDTVTLRANHLLDNPQDAAGVTIHELAHVVQGEWKNVPGYFIEGFADFIRDETGVDQVEGNAWSIPDGYESGQSYQDGYGTVAAFVKWMLVNDYFGLERLIEIFLDGSYSDEVTWPTLTGMTLDQLWETYAGM